MTSSLSSLRRARTQQLWLAQFNRRARQVRRPNADVISRRMLTSSSAAERRHHDSGRLCAQAARVAARVVVAARRALFCLVPALGVVERPALARHDTVGVGSIVGDVGRRAAHVVDDTLRQRARASRHGHARSAAGGQGAVFGARHVITVKRSSSSSSSQLRVASRQLAVDVALPGRPTVRVMTSSPVFVSLASVAQGARVGTAATVAIALGPTASEQRPSSSSSTTLCSR